MDIVKQLSFFDYTSQDMLVNGGFIAVMKASMRSAVSKSGMSRAQVVDKINALANGKALTQGSNKKISTDTFDKWLADEERGQMPSCFALSIFMKAVDSFAPLEAWLELYGCAVLTPKDKKTLEYAELVLDGKAKTKRKRHLEDELLRRG